MKKQLILFMTVVVVLALTLTSCSLFDKGDEEVTTTPEEVHVCLTGEWIISEYPTDTKDGVKQKVCLDCGSVMVEEAIQGSTGLAYTLNGKTYAVSGIGECRDSEIVIPRTYMGIPVTSIADGAFRNYTAIVSVTVGDNINAIGANAFNGCTSLSSVVLPNSIGKIGDGAFTGCSLLENVRFNGDIFDWLNIEFTGITSNPLNNAANLYLGLDLVDNLVIPAEVIQIPNYAFAGCKSLASLKVGDDVRIIGSYSFANCPALADIDLGVNTRKIETYAFSNCSKLTSVVIPDQVVTLEGYCFHKCTSVETLTFGASLYSIGNNAFDNCTSLRTVNITESVGRIAQNVWTNCIALEIVNYDGTADQWARIIFADGSANPMGINKTTKPYFQGTLVKDLVINEATQINAYAFYKCNSLESVTLGDSVAVIGAYAFQSCPILETVTLNGNVQNNAFDLCPYLESVTIGKNVTSIGGYAFASCPYLDDIYYAGSESGWTAVSKTGTWKNSSGDCTVHFAEVDPEPEPEPDPETDVVS